MGNQKKIRQRITEHYATQPVSYASNISQPHLISMVNAITMTQNSKEFVDEFLSKSKKYTLI